ncbi:MAG: hypothetical protein BJ554DRAFT_1176 [Olpidium bornovanus]|uniref:Uncharacterized protein n=1 Tax=Olpidium bornovanus TaxID=278681 RepID=A0A8H8DHL4_9FUNG|nr:MAG: hypothetical protein BJ554DRAFT_1176 [Olpidium bornovanus]
MKFAGLAPIVATLAVVFTLSAFAQSPGLLPEPITICQPKENGEGTLWDTVNVLGLNEFGRVVQVDRSLIDGCKQIEDALWIGTVHVEFKSAGSANLTEVTFKQKCTTPSPAVDERRCDPLLRPNSVRLRSAALD